MRAHHLVLRTVTFFFVATAVIAAPPAHGGKIDVHGHATVLETYSDPADFIAQMTANNMEVQIFMSTPHGLEESALEDTTDLVTAFSAWPDQVKFMYGGAELNYLLHGIGRSSSFATDADYAYRWTESGYSTSYFPTTYGCGTLCGSSTAGLTRASEIEGRGLTGIDHDLFIALAEAAALSTSPNYLGFGEIAPNHLPQRAGHPYIRFPVDHDWMKELANIAAPNNKVIDLHVELDATTVVELSNLLAYNRNTKYILEHVGWSSNGYATPAVVEYLLASNSNLYIALKKCHSAGGLACYIDWTSGTIRPAWLSIFTNSAYSSRIMIGGDAKYWQDSTTSAAEEMDSTYRDHWPGDDDGDLQVMMAELSISYPAVAAKIKSLNAKALFGL